VSVLICWWSLVFLRLPISSSAQNKGLPTRATTAYTNIYIFSYLNDNNKQKHSSVLLSLAFIAVMTER
jgi:hypothetical protein